MITFISSILCVTLHLYTTVLLDSGLVCGRSLQCQFFVTVRDQSLYWSKWIKKYRMEENTGEELYR